MALIPGVPALLTGTIAATAVTLLTADLVNIFGGAAQEQWGIFYQGSPVVLADTVTSLEYRQENNISDYPLEGGKIESYNKVYTPFEARVRLAAGGSDANRSSMLASIQAISGDYNLYDVVMPEAVYQNCNVRMQNFARTVERGRGVLAVDVALREIRISTAAGGSNTAQPDGADAMNGGSVQTTTPTSAQSSAASGIQ